MADFLTAYNTTIPTNEGGFNKDLGDGEGLTYRGLTKKSDPTWSGWSYIQDYINKNGYPANEQVFPDLEQSVQDFYQNGDGVHASYWQMAQGDAIESQDLANFIFYFFVSSGRAGKEITTAINNTLGNGTVSVSNGSLSSSVVSVLNSNTNALYTAIYNAKQAYLKSLADWGKYSKSWERGMAAFPTSISFQRVLSTKTGFFSVAAGAGLILISTSIFFYFKLKKKI
jgi:lysozyme family protein